MANRRIRVRGIRKDEIDADKLALAYWLMAKRSVELKRERDAEDKKKRRGAADGQVAKETTDAGR